VASSEEKEFAEAAAEDERAMAAVAAGREAAAKQRAAEQASPEARAARRAAADAYPAACDDVEQHARALHDLAQRIVDTVRPLAIEWTNTVTPYHEAYRRYLELHRAIGVLDLPGPEWVWPAARYPLNEAQVAAFLALAVEVLQLMRHGNTVANPTEYVNAMRALAHRDSPQPLINPHA